MAEADTKTYSLKASETNLLKFVQDRQNAIFSGILSTMVADRLAYPVTPRTQFNLSADLKNIEINELPEDDQETVNEEVAEQNAKDGFDNEGKKEDKPVVKEAK